MPSPRGPGFPHLGRDSDSPPRTRRGFKEKEGEKSQERNSTKPSLCVAVSRRHRQRGGSGSSPAQQAAHRCGAGRPSPSQAPGPSLGIFPGDCGSRRECLSICSGSRRSASSGGDSAGVRYSLQRASYNIKIVEHSNFQHPPQDSQNASPTELAPIARDGAQCCSPARRAVLCKDTRRKETQGLCACQDDRTSRKTGMLFRANRWQT